MAKQPSWLAEELDGHSQSDTANPAPANSTVAQKEPTERHSAAKTEYESTSERRKPGPQKEVPDKTYSIPMHPEMWDEAVQMGQAMGERFGVKVSVRQVLAKALETGFKQEYEEFYKTPYKGQLRS